MTRDERHHLAERVRQACLDAAREAYVESGYAGLCAEGRWELALDAIRAMALDAIIEEHRAISSPR